MTDAPRGEDDYAALRNRAVQDMFVAREIQAKTGRGGSNSINISDSCMAGIDLSTAMLTTRHWSDRGYQNGSDAFNRCDLRFADLSGTQADSVIFRDCNLCFCCFSGAGLRNAVFDEKCLTAGADFSGANLEGVRFFLDAQLLTAKFTGAKNLDKAVFTCPGPDGKPVTVTGIEIGNDGRLRPAMAHWPERWPDAPPPSPLDDHFSRFYGQVKESADALYGQIVSLVEQARANGERTPLPRGHALNALAGDIAAGRIPVLQTQTAAPVPRP